MDNFIKRYSNSTILVSYGIRPPTPYKIRDIWPIGFAFIRSTKHKQIYSFYPFSLLLQCCSSVDLTTKDGTLGLPADLGQPVDVLALTGSLPGESFDCFFASLPKN
jgi:hypothetical protein